MDAPRTWKYVLLTISIGKAFVAGAGLGIAALGLAEVTHQALAQVGVAQMWSFLQKEHVLDAFAFGGGALTSAAQVVWKVLTR